MKRRNFLKFLILLPSVARAGGFWSFFQKSEDQKLIKQIHPIDFHWPTQEPFLFCAYHSDHYPAGNKNNGLDSQHLAGRDIGQDFILKNGFRTYHGKEVPGFPAHPHRGFETITIVRKGYVDHADSIGAAGRYGEGDVQWMTAGAGVQHSEMFPLLHQDKENTLELFQLWLNLPKKNKMTSPDFKMLWANKIPKISEPGLEVSLICGEYKNHKYFEAPEKSWASDPSNSVNILLLKMKAGSTFKYPEGKQKINRSLYFFSGSRIEINKEILNGKKAVFIDPSVELSILAHDDAEILILDAKPIGEPVVQHGPFVMTSREEIMQTFHDYQKTQFGGWKWEREDIIHGSKIERFAKYPGGKIERPG